MKIIDISVTIQDGILVYPGDPEYTMIKASTFLKDEMNVSKICLGVHTGTHVDAPLHFIPEGTDIADLGIHRYYGLCQVIDLLDVAFGRGITREDLVQNQIPEGRIILLKTQNGGIRSQDFFPDHVYLTKEGAQYLIEKNTVTVGIEYLSIDAYNSNNPAHHLFLEQQIPIFENLLLSHVPPGQYFFAGGPIKLRNGDGAPARVVLIKDFPRWTYNRLMK